MASIDKIKIQLRRLRIYLSFILSIIALTLMFPGEGKFQYEFQKGKPWLHETLVAPFDFPIYKTDEALARERDSLAKEIHPFYRLDTLVLPQQISRFEETLFPDAKKDFYSGNGINSEGKVPGSNLPADSLLNQYKLHIIQVLEEIYNSGVMETALQNVDAENPDQVVNIIQNQFVEERSASRVFTLKSGYEFFNTELERIGRELQNDAKGSKLFASYIEPIDLIEANLSYDEATSRRMLENKMNEISLSEGMIQAGEKIIAVGEPVNDFKFQIIQSLKKEYESNPNVKRNYNAIFIGRLLLVAVAFSVLYLFLLHFRPEVLQSGTKTFFILMLVFLLAFLASLSIKSGTLNIYVVPFVILPIIIKTFYDARVALFVHLITVLLIGFWAPNGFEFVFMNFIAGVVAIFSLRNLYRRRVLFFSAILTFFSYSLVYTGISILQEGRIQDVEYLNYAWYAGNSLLVLASYPLIYIFERIFGFISDATLIELSDTNQPLLRRLAENAPGTFQHSMQVANLAEESAVAIGANPLLIRTGALYHDIGKLEEPSLFIENLTSNFNPHDSMEFEESAEKIINHVKAGVKMGKKNNLPDIVIDFIRTHHGTTTVQYFYKSYLKKYPEAEVDVAKFSYPGPKPFSKETAILMMADSVEAASRSLKSINKEIIRNLVENIIDYQLKENQFENVDLTIREINIIKELFRKRLINIYHARVEYPK